MAQAVVNEADFFVSLRPTWLAWCLANSSSSSKLSDIDKSKPDLMSGQECHVLSI